MSCASVGKVFELAGVNIWVSLEVQVFGRILVPSFLQHTVYAKSTGVELNTVPLLADRLGIGICAAKASTKLDIR